MAELQSCVSRMSKESGKGSSTLAECDKGSHLELANAGTLSCLFEGLNEKDQQASELLRMLNKELTEFIDLISKKDYQAMECRRKLISCFFERIVSSFNWIAYVMYIYFCFRTPNEPKRNATWTIFAVSCNT